MNYCSLFKIICCCILLLLSVFKVSAQYAIGGTAGPDLVKSVYWLTWDKNQPGSTMISSPIGSDSKHITNGTYIWQFSPTTRITAVLSNESFVNAKAITAYTPGNFAGDGLDLIYSGNNLPKPASRGVANSGLAVTSGTVSFDIDVKVALLINNSWTDILYPGIVIGDAESINANNEFISGTTPGSVAWQLLNKRVQNTAADSHYKMTLSNSGKSFKIFADLPPGDFGVQAVLFAHNARNLQHVSMKGSVLTALAIGLVLPFDVNNGLPSYGVVGSYIDQFKINSTFVADGTYAVVTYNTTPLIAASSVLIGSGDKKTFNPGSLPVVKANQDVNLLVPVTNTKNIPAQLYCWIDFNNDGVFSPDESVIVDIPPNTINQKFKVSFPNAQFNNKIKAGNLLYLRLRITTAQLIDDSSTAIDERSAGFSSDGEAEDYNLKSLGRISVTGSIYDDGNGALDGLISGNGIQSVSGNQLYVYLTNSVNKIVGKSTVSASGSYLFSDINIGSYTANVSTKSLSAGDSFIGDTDSLLGQFVPSGAYYGINNAAGKGIQPGLPAARINVINPDDSLNISEVNFGLNKIPVAGADSAATVVNKPIVIDLTANDKDADGTLDPTSILLIDPADNLSKTSLTIPGKGQFAVDPKTGKVTFTPATDFAGIVNTVYYTIKDNFGSNSNKALITIRIDPGRISVTGSIYDDGNGALDGLISGNGIQSVSGNQLYVYLTNSVNKIVGKSTVSASGSYLFSDVNIGSYTANVSTKSLSAGDSFIGDTDSLLGQFVPSGAYYGINNAAGKGIQPGLPAARINVINPDDSLNISEVNFGLNQIPVARADSAVTVVNKPIVIDLTVNDKDTDGTLDPTSILLIDPADNLSKASLTIPGKGQFAVDPKTGKLTFTPATDFAGIVNTVYYTIKDNFGSSGNKALITIRIDLLGVNDDVFTDINTPVTTAVKSNDGLSAQNATVIAKNGSHGTTAVDSTGNVIYTPTKNFIGKDSYTYTLSKSGSVSSNTVTVTVNVKPVGVNDTDSTFVNTAVTTVVRANDGPSGVGTDVVATNGHYGTTTVDGSGNITYTPSDNYVGGDTYTYTLITKDGVSSDEITVNINVVFSKIIIPTLFTPNGDGINDFFEIRVLPQYFKNELTIINRWGNEVYRQINYQNNWDGHGLAEGTYFYLLRVKREANSAWEPFKGYVTLIRAFKK